MDSRILIGIIAVVVAVVALIFIVVIYTNKDTDTVGPYLPVALPVGPVPNLNTSAGKAWLGTAGGKAWLGTAGGNAWLGTAGGNAWLGTAGGRAWSITPDGQYWGDNSPYAALDFNMTGRNADAYRAWLFDNSYTRI